MRRRAYIARNAALSSSAAVADLPDTIQAFLRHFIDSVEQLEILLLLRARGHAWTADTVTREISTSIESATARLESLTRSGLLAKTARDDGAHYRYAPSDPSAGRSVDQLAEIYPRRRVAIITFIFSPPDESLRDFSDAFRLRRKGR